jgi:soluble lytic murein transglycosylase
MKQAIIAFMVCATGAGTVGGLLLGSSEPQTDLAKEPMRSVALKTSRVVTNSVPDTAEAKPATPDLALRTQTSTGSTTVVPPVASDTIRQALKALSARKAAEAIRLRDELDPGSIEAQTLSWAIAISGQTAVTSRTIADARAKLAGWPGLGDIEANLERALYREQALEQAQVWLSGRTPVTVEGTIVLARAETARGDSQRAQALIRHLWHEKTFEPAFETVILDEFGALLSQADHRQRMAHLLFAERITQAKRFAEMTGAQSLLEAFSSVVRKSRDAAARLNSVDAAERKDPLYLFARIKMLRQARRYEEAAALFKAMPTARQHLADADSWWVEARIVSRGLMDMGRADEAYALAAAHRAESPADIAEAEFHAGWFALRAGRPDTAETHFRKLLAVSSRTHDQARGYYWLGRAAEAAKRPAKQAFQRAADYPATFYGQMASAKLGIPIEPGHRYPSLDYAATFAARPEMQAIALLEQSGEAGRARRLYLALAASLDSPVDLQALAEVALSKHGPSLALAIGKAAQRQGHDPGLAAFPLGAIPDSADISGAGRALAYAIARQESAFNPAAISPANARGLLQLLPSTAKRVASRYQMAWAEERLIDDPAYNATLGSHYLGEQIDRFNGSYILTFAAYNAGPGRIPDWIRRYGDPRGLGLDASVDWVENIPYQETRDYVQRVMENFQVYKRLLNEPVDITADMTAGAR